MTHLEQEKQFLKSLSLIHIQPQPQIQPRLASAITLCIDDIPARQIMLKELNYYIQYNKMSKILINFGKNGCGCEEKRGLIRKQRKEIENMFPHLKWGNLNKNFLNCFQDILVKK